VKNFVTDPKGVKTSKNKKKNRRKKEQQKNSSLKEASELNKKVVLNVLLYNVYIIELFSTRSIFEQTRLWSAQPNVEVFIALIFSYNRRQMVMISDTKVLKLRE